METNTQLQQMVATLPDTKAKILLDKFNDYFNIAAEWETKLDTLVVTDESQVAEMKMAGEARKFLKKKRTEIENTRKEMKEDALREGNMIDGIAKVLKSLIEPLEKKAEKIENFAEELQALRKQQLYADRKEKLVAFGWTDVGVIHLGDMGEDDFDIYLKGMQSSFEQKQKEKEAQRLAEIEKQRLDEKARIARENRVKLYNERKDQLIPYWDFVPQEMRKDDLSLLTEALFEDRLAWLKEQKATHVAEQQRIAMENEKLHQEKAQADAKAEKLRKEAQDREDALKIENDWALAIERVKAKEKLDAQAEETRKAQAKMRKREIELKPYIVYIRDYTKTINLPDAEYDKELKDLNTAAMDQMKYEAEKPQIANATSDKQRLLNYKSQFEAIEIPVMTTPDGMQATVAVGTLRKRFLDFLDDKIRGLK